MLVDTPGIFAPRRRLDRAMVDAAWSGSAKKATWCCVMVDVERGLNADAERILKGSGKNLAGLKALVLNKIDKTGKDKLLALTSNRFPIHATFDQTFMISALRGHGVADLKNWLVEKMPLGPWHFPEDQLVDAPMMLTAAEITREKIYLRLHQELPYASTVETTEWKNLDNGSVRIEQTIFVERDSQKMIVLGKGGRSIKAISQESRHELAEILDMPVHLFLFVKVRENWGDDPERYRGIGLDFPKE